MPTFLKVVAALLAVVCLPIVAFMALYSIDAGCFLCLEGKAAGGVTEKALNLGLLGLILLFVVAVIVDAIRRRRR